MLKNTIKILVMGITNIMFTDKLLRSDKLFSLSITVYFACGCQTPTFSSTIDELS